MDARGAGGPLGGGQLVAHAALGAPGTHASYHTVSRDGKVKGCSFYSGAFATLALLNGSSINRFTKAFLASLSGTRASPSASSTSPV
jgi:hypothetical protein